MGIGNSELGGKKSFNTPTAKSPNPTLIDILHRLLWLIEHKPQEISDFIAVTQPDTTQLRLVAQALAGRTLTDNSSEPTANPQTPMQRTQEQQAIDTLLASWKRVIEENLFTRGD